MRILLLVLVCCLSFSHRIEAGLFESLRSLIWKTETKAPPMIDVLIVNDRPNTLLEVNGRYQLYDPNTKKLLAKRHMGKKKLIQTHPSGIKWGEEFPGIYQIEIIPEEMGGVFVDNKQYNGSLFVYDIGGSISIVNRVPIEDFLLCVMPQKFPGPFSEETLSAIAIAQRTDCVYHSRHPKNKFWAIDGQKFGYQGLMSCLPESGIDRAIRATRHMILSKTGPYEGFVTPFPIEWESVTSTSKHSRQTTHAQISLADAEKMAEDGHHHAAFILSQAFPGSHIEIIY